MPRRFIVFPSGRITQKGHLPFRAVLEHRAYAIWEDEGWPKGRADVHMELARHEFQEMAAYFDWVNAGKPDGLDKEHMRIAGLRMRIAERADSIFAENGWQEEWYDRAWDQATAELLYV